MEEHKIKYLSIHQALTRLQNKGIHRSRQTLINWCKKYGVGHKIGGDWMISQDKLDAFVSGEKNGTDEKTDQT